MTNYRLDQSCAERDVQVEAFRIVRELQDHLDRAAATFLDRIAAPNFTEAGDWQLEGGEPAVPAGWTRHLTQYERTGVGGQLASGGNGVQVAVCGTQWGDGSVANVAVHIDHVDFAELDAAQTRELIGVLAVAADIAERFGGVRR